MNLDGLPQEFLERMRRILGVEEYQAFLDSYSEPRKFGLRVNTLKITVEEFCRIAPFHLTPIPWIPNGFFYEREDDPARHPFYYAGLYYLQEPSAMTPACVLPVAPGERVLDLCAAPGGKATALGAKLGGSGLLVANDISASRAKALLKNLEIFGITNSFVTNTAPAKLAERFTSFFDKILVDAPCSGEGMFRKDIANARAWSLKKVEECAKLQREITRQAVKMLRPGGMMLYSTCTFSPEEDEQAVAELLAACPEMELMDIPWYGGFAPGKPELAQGISGENGLPGSAALGKCVRIFPHRMPGEGHFMALLRKRGEGGESAFSGSSRCMEEENGLQNLENFGNTEEEHTASDRMAASPKCRKTVAWERSRGKMGVQASLRRETDVQTFPCREPDVQETPQGKARVPGKSHPKRSSMRPVQEKGQDRRKKCPQSGEQEALDEFLQDVSGLSGGATELRNGQAYYVANRVPTDGGIPFLRNGLYLGEVKKGRFEPSQSLAMALRGDGYASVLNFAQDDERVRRYLRGETLETDDLQPARKSGWQLVCVEGYPLGWGKLVNGTLKNKYHPGWRLPG